MVCYFVFDYYRDKHFVIDSLFFAFFIFIALVFIIYNLANGIYEVISTRVVLHSDYFLFKSRKKNIQIKYEDIESIMLSRGSPQIKDIYGNRISLSRSLIRNVKELTDNIMSRAVNASLPEDIKGHGKSNYIFYCEKCKKEYYVESLTASCPKCGKKHLQLDISLDFQIVKNKKINEFIMYVLGVVFAICLISLLLFVTYKFHFR